MDDHNEVESWSYMWSYFFMKTTSISLSEAKVHLSAWSRRVEAGENIVVLKHNRPAFVIAPLPVVETRSVKKPGLAKGMIRMAADFDGTPESVIREFEDLTYNRSETVK